MQNLSIPIKGCKNIEDMKERILAHLSSRKDNRLACNEAFKVISEAQSMDKKKSLALLDYYAKVEREIQGLDATFLDLLKTSEGDFLSKIKTRIKRMQDRDYVLLIAAKAAAFEALKPLVEAQLELAVNTLNDLQARIPMLVESDVRLCQQLIEEAQSKRDSEARYKPCRDKCERLRVELTLFGSMEIRFMRLSWDDLSWDVSEDVYLKRPIEPGLYHGHISKGRCSLSGQVTFKVYRELLTSSNIIECLAEEGILRY
ncbi:unnamed protein product, partial [Pocillopora meandrina]